jgi:hypothetical protein
VDLDLVALICRWLHPDREREHAAIDAELTALEDELTALEPLVDERRRREPAP